MTPTGDPTLTELSSSQCYDLLQTARYGRLGLVAEHYPLIIPINYAMDGGVIVFRSGPGTKLTNAEQANVTFQVDEIDQQRHSGWTVLVRGQAEEVTAGHSDDLVERTKATGLQPWIPGTDFRWVRIIPHAIAGRRIVPGHAHDWELGTAAYM